MDFLHCNKCFKLPGGGAHFVITSCFHTLCTECVPADGQVKTCQICKTQTKCIPINKDMNEHVKRYFKDPKTLLEDHTTKMTRKMDFQQLLTSHLTSRISKERIRLKEMAEAKCKAKIESVAQHYQTERKKMKEWIVTSERKLKEIKKENAALKTEIAILKNGSRMRSLNDGHLFEASDCLLDQFGSSDCSSFHLSSPASSLASDLRMPPILELADRAKNSYESTRSPMRNDNTTSFCVAFNNMVTPSRALSTPKQPGSSSSHIRPHNLSDQFARSCESVSRQNSLRASYSPYMDVMNQSQKSMYGQPASTPVDKMRNMRRQPPQPGTVTRNSIIPASYLDWKSND